MDIKCVQVVEYKDYFTSKPDGDAAIDLRISSVAEVVYRPFSGEKNWLEFGSPTGLSELPARHGSMYWLEPGKIYMVNTGIKVQVPNGYAGLVSLRSSGGKYTLVMPNAPGVIDSSYRGIVQVLVTPSIMKTVVIPQWSRFAQMTVIKHENLNVQLVPELEETDRGEGGFGSTGVK